MISIHYHVWSVGRAYKAWLTFRINNKDFSFP
uniref:Uncharacterized protein n=1 Tax=Anguilla anguilla TaxID=7936 RepID=A0A0E9T4N1_ANGAN